MNLHDLLDAAENGETQKVIELIKQGAPVGFDDDVFKDDVFVLRDSALIKASMNNHIDTVKAIFEYGNPNDITNEDLQNSLLNTNELEIAKILVKHGADAKNERTIQAACTDGKTEIVKFLHEQGAEFTKHCIQGAVSGGHLDIVKYLDENGCKVIDHPECLGIAIFTGSNNVAHYCLSQGTDIHHQSDHALKTAASEGNYGAAKMLIVDFNMPVKQDTKDWLEMKGADDVLDLIKKRDLTLRLESKLKTKQEKSMRLKL